MYILKNLLVLFYIFNIFYKLDRIFYNKFNLIYHLYILFHSFIIINNIKNLSNFFLKKDLFLKEPLYFSFDNFKKIYFSFGPDLLVCLISKVSQNKENASVLWDIDRQKVQLTRNCL